MAYIAFMLLLTGVWLVLAAARMESGATTTSAFISVSALYCLGLLFLCADIVFLFGYGLFTVLVW